jgi:prepilin-type N-terminal cleavage/methylation domain-containing protein
VEKHLNNQKTSAAHKDHGFTILEVIAVLIILGIITAIVVNRMSGNVTELLAQTDVIKSHLRYAQSRAMNSNMAWGIYFNNNSYWLYKNGNIADKVALPGEDSNDIILPSGISFGTFIVSFDIWGKPHTDAQALTAQVGTRTITVSDGTQNVSINITQNTGYIP